MEYSRKKIIHTSTSISLFGYAFNKEKRIKVSLYQISQKEPAFH